MVDQSASGKLPHLPPSDDSVVAEHRLLARSTDALWVINPDGVFTFVSPACGKVLGWESHELVGKSVDAFFPRDHRATAVLNAGVASSEGIVEHQFRQHDGSYRWVETTVARVPNPTSGEMNEIQGSTRDITERKAGEAVLAEANERFSLAFDNAPIGMALMGIDGRFTQVNDAFCRITGRSVAELATMTSEEITHVDDIANDRICMQQLIDGLITSYVGEKRYCHAGGRVIWASLSISLLRGVDGEVREFIVQVEDVTERKVSEDKLTHLALHDGLTGLPNRELFLDRTRHALALAKRTVASPSILFLDLDHFKVVNDSMGHSAGDALLVRVAERLTRVVRPSDTLARLGGDEFTLLCEGLEDEHEIEHIADRITKAFRDPIRIHGRDVVVTTSIGIATAERLGNVRAEDLLQQADAALYRAKDRGRARYEMYNVGLRAHAMQRLEVEQALRGAAERGELRVWYQPQFALPSRELIGVEALVRWQHPTRGLLEPKEFIDVAEETGLVVNLGTRVLEEACRQSHDWSDRFGVRGSVPISVNLSARQLGSGDFVAIAQEILERFAVPACRVHFEITEAGLMKVHGSASRELNELRELGLQVGIDDFGTGYSSLALLAAISVDFLKIDTSFVAGLGVHEQDEAIVGAVIALAHSLRLSAVAEGAETAGQITALTKLGCDAVQGFLLGRPQPANALDALLRS
jgi:diguanylate cyclase (GGDEF)-like protein/PAS domain S-box-containing protein